MLIMRKKIRRAGRQRIIRKEVLKIVTKTKEAYDEKKRRNPGGDAAGRSMLISTVMPCLNKYTSFRS
jgi:hypothetical protein